ARICQNDWDYCIQKGIYDHQEEALARQTELNYTVTGMLLYYINRRQPLAYEEFMATSSMQIERILR
ncbi:MAG: hypothetical protein NTV01_05740, partial [Bacteroidia bacterium]|nr:hypothetical protein [Bacteroidia bacterium]